MFPIRSTILPLYWRWRPGKPAISLPTHYTPFSFLVRVQSWTRLTAKYRLDSSARHSMSGSNYGREERKKVRKTWRRLDQEEWTIWFYLLPPMVFFYPANKP